MNLQNNTKSKSNPCSIPIYSINIDKNTISEQNENDYILTQSSSSVSKISLEDTIKDSQSSIESNKSSKDNKEIINKKYDIKWKDIDNIKYEFVNNRYDDNKYIFKQRLTKSKDISLSRYVCNNTLEDEFKGFHSYDYLFKLKKPIKKIKNLFSLKYLSNNKHICNSTNSQYDNENNKQYTKTFEEQTIDYKENKNIKALQSSIIDDNDTIKITYIDNFLMKYNDKKNVNNKLNSFRKLRSSNISVNNKYKNTHNLFINSKNNHLFPIHRSCTISPKNKLEF